MRTIARQAPLDALRFFEDQFNVMESERESFLAQALADSWSEVDLGAALDWATTQEFTRRQTQFDAVSIVLRKLARTSYGDALKQIQRRFGDELIADSLKLAVIDEVASNDSEAAIELLDQVGTFGAHVSVGRRLLKDQHFEKAIEIGNRLEGIERENYLASISTYWAHSSPILLLDSIESFPTAESKSHAAFNLLRHYIQKRSLSEVEVQYARTFLSDKHEQQLLEDFGPGNLYDRTTIHFVPPLEIDVPSAFGTESDFSIQVSELFRMLPTN
jgi:hypothetical protein